MPKFESTPNIDNPELNPAEAQADVNVGKKLEGELTPEELEKLKVEKEQRQEQEKPELSPEEQLKNLEGEMESRQQEMTRLTESIERTKSKLNEVREKLGLPPTEEEPPSTFLEKEKLEKLKAEQEALEKQKKELVSQQEKERLIREEKEKILQEKINKLRAKIEVKKDRQDIIKFFESASTGEKKVYREGRRVEESFLETNLSKSVLVFFKDGQIDKIIAGPEADVDKIIETIAKDENSDENLTQEAERRVEQRLREEKAKMEEEQKKEEKPEEPKPEEKPKVPEGEIPPGEIKPEVNPIEGGNIESPKA
jgi:hypothetical protein